ncbi:transcription termination factor NusA [bacterium]|nr:transcription termination factor NusA [bacterium]NDA10121.1 transcription termination factor NusA [Verrucomicrobiota bacterium]NDA26215.1 transcription termination factor NusA [Verrucomicrobiota bacterium]NDD81850.1 transcription termination factor NusA [Verrucomicrobiota bacterium]
MNTQDFLTVLDYMEKEKGISRKVMASVIESALVTAAHKTYPPETEIRVALDAKTGKIQMFAKLKATDRARPNPEEISIVKARSVNPSARLGDLVEIELDAKQFGRIAAQVFKQAMNQNLRSIEKTMIMEEFQGRVGDIVAGTVRRFDRADVVIDLGKFEGIMPARERVPTEEYTPGERIRALVLAVQQGQRGPEIILSRASPDFVRRLLALEVAELADGVVQIKSLAREPGFRTKIAVWSDVEKVDPVGACVGIRGSRVKNIVRELNNEKVDLFRWSPNVHELVIEALKPAKLRKIEIDETNHRVRALVDAENLSLAIGRKGHNARLASRLTGWHIDVEEDKTEVVGFEQKLEQAVQGLATALGIEVPLAQKIASVGFSTVEALVEATETDLAEAVPDLTPEQAKEILTKAQAALAAAKS